MASYHVVMIGEWTTLHHCSSRTRAMSTDIVDVDRSLWPDDPVVALPGGRHCCQEDAPDVLAAAPDGFIQSTR